MPEPFYCDVSEVDAESAALRAIRDALPEGQARFRSVEPTGMGRNDYYDAATLALLAFKALRALPVEQRMKAMGMRSCGWAFNEPQMLWKEIARVD